MSHVPDRKKMRREYLRKKRRLNAVQIVGFLFLMPALLIPIWAAVAALVLFRYNALYGLATIVGIGFWLWLVRRVWRALVEVEKRERTLPYVPPMTPNALPANEVLVRSSQPSEIPQSEMLLRAARGSETPAEELLRVATSIGENETF